jgi:hypothetical protein
MLEIEAIPTSKLEGFGYDPDRKVEFVATSGKGMNLKRREWRRSKMI